MTKASVTTFCLLFAGLVALAGCDARLAQRDYYSEVKALCPDPKPYRGWFDLPQECLDAISGLVDWDESFFVEPEDRSMYAAEDARQIVVEALYTLLVYPLELPEDPRDLHVFGVGHGAFAADLLCAILPDHYSRHCPEFSRYESVRAENLNQAFFNYLLSRMGNFKRKIEFSESIAAFASTNGDTTVYENLLRKSPFSVVSILIHEARHHDTIWHQLCEGDGPSEGRECDSDLGGPQGVEVLYSEALLHGNARYKYGRFFLLSYDSAYQVVNGACFSLLTVQNLPEAVAHFRDEYLLDENGEAICNNPEFLELLRVFDPEIAQVFR